MNGKDTDQTLELPPADLGPGDSCIAGKIHFVMLQLYSLNR